MILQGKALEQYKSRDSYMLDIETLDNTVNSAIIGIACVRFVPLTGEIIDTFKTPVNFESCFPYGGTISQSTLRWWLDKDLDVLKSLMESNVHINEALLALSKFMKKLNEPDPILYCKGGSFDFAIIDNYYDKANINNDWWKHYLENDIRALFATCPELIKTVASSGTKHDPLSDCFYQIDCLKAWLEEVYDIAENEEMPHIEIDMCANMLPKKGDTWVAVGGSIPVPLNASIQIHPINSNENILGLWKDSSLVVEYNNLTISGAVVNDYTIKKVEGGEDIPRDVDLVFAKIPYLHLKNGDIFILSIEDKGSVSKYYMFHESGTYSLTSTDRFVPYNGQSVYKVFRKDQL